MVVKPVQTGIGGADPEPRDARTVERLTGVECRELVALDDPLAPDTAARRQGVALPPVSEHVGAVLELAADHDVVLVEGAGGLLVRLDTDGGTLLDLAVGLTEAAPPDVTVDVVVVARAGLGTLNHTALTVEALRDRGVEPLGLVVGAWPERPGLAETCNRDDLPRVTGVPVVAVLPAGSGSLAREEFVTTAPSWFVGQASQDDR
ncbi:ATP-dependent dethiobiotin synthetase BioD [Aeromicrobium erythreum]|uniref:ATP-dependent dethiobiotin synthetase BioD n=1 Tax=Aeromicrobium erythreum TaxID=2041 RepID=UPI001F241873|nr:ATP-dependent dethiobiotin synthetase BioD [Aeromicrobium erythreum]